MLAYDTSRSFVVSIGYEQGHQAERESEGFREMSCGLLNFLEVVRSIQSRVVSKERQVGCVAAACKARLHRVQQPIESCSCMNYFFHSDMSNVVNMQ